VPVQVFGDDLITHQRRSPRPERTHPAAPTLTVDPATGLGYRQPGRDLSTLRDSFPVTRRSVRRRR
jgi:hypothetical protein